MVSGKIGYLVDFRLLLEEIADECMGLLFEVGAPTYIPLSMREVQELDPAVLLFQVRRLMARDRLPTAIESILLAPHAVLNVSEDYVPLGRASPTAPDRISSSASLLDWDEGGPASSLFAGYSPPTLIEETAAETWDTRENQFIKAFLEDLLQRVEMLVARLEKSRKVTVHREAMSWATRIADWLSHPLWREVGRLRVFPSNSQVLQRRQGYRAVLEADIALQMGVRLPWNEGVRIGDGLEGDARPVSKLYEYWCYFKLRRILRGLCGPERLSRNSLVTTSEGGLTLNLRTGRSSRIVFDYGGETGSPLRISLFYNRSFLRAEADHGAWTGSYSSTFHPDYSLLIEALTHPGGAVIATHWLHFDAKYKLDFHRWRAEIEDDTNVIEQELQSDGAYMDEEQVDTFRRGDLYKMHTYRDALLGSRGAYILFPGSSDDETLFIRHPSYHFPNSTYWFPSVGAFQLHPQDEGMQASKIEQHIATVIGALSANASKPYVEEEGLFGQVPT